MTPDELVAQRWFRAKQRPIDRVVAVDRAPAPPNAELSVAEVSYRDGGPPDRYLLIAADGREPADGDGAWRALVRAMADEAELPGERGSFLTTRTGAMDELLPPGGEATLDERRLRVEQSNTSVVIGERLILKLYRLLEPGDNPDLEMSAFLTDAGFADTPALAGSMRYASAEGWSATAAMLQSFVPSEGDAWASMGRALDRDPDAGVEIAARIGEVTASLHRALGSRPGVAAFPARPATADESASWRALAEHQLAEAVTAVSGAAHERMVELAPRLRARFADTFGAAAGEARVTRIHGDYHLGQLLARPDGRFSVIDFEGEPARPLAERRRPSSPLRDVAGMLRSLDYAARTAARSSDLDADAWLARARAAFLDGYGGIEAASVPLLEAFELEKACYEVRYEANNRPEWMWLPLGAVERLAAG